MGNLWICKDKRRLYQQCNFAGESETEDGIARIKLRRVVPINDLPPSTDPWAGDSEGFWVNRDELELVSFEMIQAAFIKLEITY